MPHRVEDFLESDAFFVAVLHCAREMLAIYRESPRIASIFAAQQRWLMAHAGFALHFGYPGEPKLGLYSGRFIAFVVANRIASRNTAAAFIQEMLAYRFLRPVESASDKRTRLLEPTETAHEHFFRWLATHLFILDSLDGGNRLDRINADPSAFAKMQPLISKAIIDSDAVRDPGATYNLFNWANSGGLIMDYLMSRIDTFDRRSDRVDIGRLSLKDIRDQFMISNTHLKRLLTQASEMGSVGWTQPPYKGDTWLSQGFVMEYWGYQAAKFAVVDAAAEAVLGPAAGKTASLR
ncbi:MULTISPECIES: hypothetical protein [unclassified Rhizobium]|uniref:hypothetical protein n=1 Tax=unclassified Rhizobium TaxID=2613769 RepID=UPI002169FF15|nr:MULTISPECIES: hypothetical protein [unclassified Rhizobium]MCS3741475.1 hypothetical protein [Rhizobium sp. BK661]MCS4093927.1 hypothetical protein [Rhizobium sp. BK176]